MPLPLPEPTLRPSRALLTAAWLWVALFAPAASASPCEAALATPAPPQAAFGAAIAQSVLDAHARLEAGERPSVEWVDGDRGAWYCRAQDAVRVSLGLLDYAWRGRASDGADLLAFVIAHELAHRRFDRDHRMSGLTGEACPDADTARREARADERAAFLLALAVDPFERRAFSPFSLARRDALAALLTHEHGWPPHCPATAARAAAVTRATERMAELGAMYEAAVLLTFAPIPERGREAALRLVERMARASQGPWSALPELELFRAILHLDRAQAAASWCSADLAHSGLDPDPCAETCAVPFPAHAALSPFDAVGRRGSSSSIAAVELSLARQHLAAARAHGVATAQLEGVEVCLAYAEAAPERGLALLARSARLARTDAHSARRIAEVRALLERQRALLSATAPVHTEAWRDEVPLPVLAAPHDLAPSHGLAPPVLPGASPCKPTRTLTLDGWHLAVGPSCLELDAAGSRLSLLDAPASGDLAPWRTNCHLTRAGYADDGARVQGASCPSDTAPWLVTSRGERVTRLTRVLWRGR